MSDDVRAAVLAALRRIAPEVDPATVRADRRLRGEVELDSVDWLRFLTEIERTLGVAVPEGDTAAVETLDALVKYVADRRA